MCAKVNVSLPDDGTGAVNTEASAIAAKASSAGSSPEKSAETKSPGTSPADTKQPETKPTETRPAESKDSATPNPDGSVHVEFHEKKTRSKKKSSDQPAPSATTATAPAQKKRTILSPFSPPGEKRSRLKMFVWGGPGAGKTFFSLQFPGVAIVDADNGTDPYKETFKFEVRKTTNVDEVRRLVEWLATNDHDYTTLVIDPFTVLWESWQHKWSDIFLERNTKSKGYKHEFYEMQVRDWQAIKSDLKSFIRQLLALDMNIVVTARSKVQYKGGSGDFMVADGDTFDGEKSLPYMFDTILHLDVVNGKRVAHCTKDRWNIFPMDKEFELSYSLVEKVWSKDALSQPSQQVVLPPEEEVVRDVPEVPKATAGQMADIAILVNELGFTEAQVQDALAARECSSYDQLTEEQAIEILESLTAAKSARSAPQ